MWPVVLTFESEQFSPGWRSVKRLNGYVMDRKTPAMEWTLILPSGRKQTKRVGAWKDATFVAG